MTSDLEAAWSELHDAKPDGWFVGQPMYHEHRREWEQCSFDTRENARPDTGRGSGRPSRDRVEVVREMNRCLRIISEGLTPT